jgi:polysaccharide deacetylase family protein (PEP-CTERM system associated)
MADEGHEVASHSWDHRRVHRFTPRSFREDVRTSIEALQEASGGPVVGFRAPTFSVTRDTAWAVDVLAELGLRYDSSIFPVRHDRYGVPDAPRSPFVVRGERHELLELPLLTWRALGQNLPVAGGGYFRLFPLFLMERGIRQMPAASVLYFHPWEFDPDQPKLPLNRLSSFRTYVGIGRSRERLTRLLGRHRFARLIDCVDGLARARESLPHFALAAA